MNIIRQGYCPLPLRERVRVRGDFNGFTLIEVIVVVAILFILTGAMIPFVYRVWESTEIDTTKERMSDLKKAMVGDPRLIQNGVRTHFAFVGDNGQLPGTISNALLPYMPGGYDPNNYNKDAWRKEFVYTIVATDAKGRIVSATLKSAGPDGIIGGLSTDDFDEVIAHKNYTPDAFIAVKEVTPANIIQGNLNITFQTPPEVEKYFYIGVSVRYAGATTPEICCDNNKKTIYGTLDNKQKNYPVNFSCIPVNNLPMGTAYLTPGLFSDSICSIIIVGNPLELSVNVNNSSVFADLQIQSVP